MVKQGLFSLFHVLGRISFSGNSGDFYTYWWTAAFLKRLIYITMNHPQSQFPKDIKGRIVLDMQEI